MSSLIKHASVPLLGAVLLAACTIDNPNYCEGDFECLDPARPFCDIKGEHPASNGVNNWCIPRPAAGAGPGTRRTPQGKDAAPDGDAPDALFDAPPDGDATDALLDTQPDRDAGDAAPNDAGQDVGTGVAKLTVAKNGTGSGTITSVPAGINCGGICSADFRVASVTLQAAPAPNSAFTGWAGAGCVGTESCTVVLDAVESVTAAFKVLRPELVLTPAQYDFGYAALNDTTGARVFTIANQGEGTSGQLAVSLLNDAGTASSEYRIVGNNCTFLGPGNICSVTVAFVPTEVGSRSAKLLAAVGSSASTTAALTGVGASSELEGFLFDPPQTLVPSFSASRLSYTSQASPLLQRLSVTPFPRDPSALVTINGQSIDMNAADPSQEVALLFPQTRISVVVSPAAGATRSYNITVDGSHPVEQLHFVKSSATEAGAECGHSVALSGDTLAVGAPQTAGGGTVDVYRRASGIWKHEVRLLGENTEEGDLFGHRVALSADLLAVSAIGEASGATGIDNGQDRNDAGHSGAVYLFRRGKVGWQQEAYIKASNTGKGDWFGYDVALSGDLLAVGARNEDSSSTVIDAGELLDDGSGAGAVYLFRRGVAGWQQEAYVKAPNADRFDEFGCSVAVSDDTLAVGACGEDSSSQVIDVGRDLNDSLAVGAVYIFRRDILGWRERTYIKPSHHSSVARFGFSLALSGELLVVGAPFESARATGINSTPEGYDLFGSGAVYVYRRTSSKWREEAYVKPSNTQSNAQYDQNFGTSVALWGDLVVVGAPYEDKTNHANSGAAYLFLYDGSWHEQERIEALDGLAEDLFGSTVALSADALAVGTPGESSSAVLIDGDGSLRDAVESGAVYLFR